MSSAQTLDTIVVDLTADAGGFNATMDKAESKLRSTVNMMAAQLKTAASAVNRNLDTIATKMQQVGRNTSLYLSTPLAGLGALAVHEMSKFDDAMTQARAIMGRVSPQMQKEIEGTVLKLSEMSRFSPAALADGLKQLAAAGLNVEQSMSALPIVEKFATAGAFDLETATQLLTDSQSALNLTVQDTIKNQQNMIRVSDALVKAGDQSTASPKQFAEALANGAADAKQWGAEIETVMALLDAYASKGNKGAAAGSDMARAFKLMKKAFSEHGDEFRKNGIEVVDKATGEYRNFIDVIKDLETAMVGMTGPQRTQLLDSLGFEALAQGAILPLVGMSDAMKEWEKQQKSATGYTENVAKIQLESFANQMKMLYNQLTVISIEIGTIMLPTLHKMAEGVRVGIAWWKELSAEKKKWVVIVGAAIAALGPLTAGLGIALSAIGAMKAGVVALGVTSITTAGLLTALKFAAAGLAVAGIAMVAKYLYDSNPAIVAYNDALEASISLEKRAMQANLERQNAMMKEAEGKTGQEKVTFLAKELELAEKNSAGLANALGYAKAGVEDMNTTWNSFTGNKILANAKEEVKQLSGRLDAARENTTALQKAYKAAKDELANASTPVATKQMKDLDEEVKETEKSIQKLIDKVKLEEATYGMTAEEVMVYKLQLKGATEEQLKAAAASAAYVKQMDEQKKATKKIEADAKKANDRLEDMKIEAQTFGMTARQAEIYRMALDGASAAQIEAAKSSDRQMTALEANKKKMEDAKDLTKKFRPPLQALTERHDELKKMLDDQMITVDVFNEAMKEAEQQFGKKYRAEFSVSGIDSVETGTAAALAKLMEFQRAKDQNFSAKGAAGKYDKKKDALSVAAKPVEATMDFEYMKQKSRETHGFRGVSPEQMNQFRQEAIARSQGAKGAPGSKDATIESGRRKMESLLERIADNTAPADKTTSGNKQPIIVMRPAALSDRS